MRSFSSTGKNIVQKPLGILSAECDFLLEVSNVAGRTDILLHQGNSPKHTIGCICLGPAQKRPDGTVFIDENHPLRKLRLAFYGTDEPISTPDKKITITIKDASIGFEGVTAPYNGNTFTALYNFTGPYGLPLAAWGGIFRGKVKLLLIILHMIKWEVPQ